MPTLSDSMRETLEARHYATLATHNEDGSIHTMTHERSIQKSCIAISLKRL
jgi:hypothetical protein